MGFIPKKLFLFSPAHFSLGSTQWEETRRRKMMEFGSRGWNLGESRSFPIIQTQIPHFLGIARGETTPRVCRDYPWNSGK